MHRRTFTKNLFLAGASPLIAPTKIPSLVSERSIVKAKALKEGETIGLIAPGSPLKPEAIDKAISQVSELGFKYKLGKHARKKFGFLAGKDGERLEDLHGMFADSSVDAIWCLRGGYGCTRLLPNLDYRLIRRYPKLLMGYSDITALHMALLKWTGLASLHSPVAVSELTDYTLNSFLSATRSGSAGTFINIYPEHMDERVKIWRKGVTSGPLIGGNLSLLSAICGTPYLPSFKDKIIFLEDVGEKPYRIDRMLVQLLQATDLSEANGIILGRFEDCDASENSDSLTIMEVFENLLYPIGVPMISGFSFGHIDNQCTFPQGIRGKLFADDLKVELLENVVI
jgi:muramoyltetrapeptide carboxypeptidase